MDLYSQTGAKRTLRGGMLMPSLLSVLSMINLVVVLESVVLHIMDIQLPVASPYS